MQILFERFQLSSWFFFCKHSNTALCKSKQDQCFFVYLLCEKEQGVQEVLVYMRACGWSWAPWCFPLPWGKVPQCHCCPHSVAEQGGPGGGAECSTVKRGRSACWHLPSLTAAGRGKICFSICLCSLQPFPPPTAPPTLFCPPFPSLNQMAPWTLFTLGDSPRCRVCPSASPFRPVSFLIPLLPLSWSASWSSCTQVAKRLAHPFTHSFCLSITFFFYSLFSHLHKQTSSHHLSLTPNPKIHCFSDRGCLSPSPLVFHALCVLTYGSSLMAAYWRWK